MPVTAKLSRRFYEAVGDDVANEFVEWFNSVDTTYRNDLRELNEVNFARFRAETEAGFARADAKIELRAAEVRQEMAAGFAKADAKLEQRVAEIRQEMTVGFAKADAKLELRTAELRQEIMQHSTALRAEIYDLRAHVDTGFEKLRTEMAAQRADLVKWMFAFWIPTAAGLIGLYVRK